MNREKKSTIPVSSVDIREKRYDPHTDSYLILGKLKDALKPGKEWLTAWQPRGKSFFVDESLHKSEAAAQRRFSRVTGDLDLRSDHSLLQKDWQQRKLYDWEDEFVMPHSRKITPKQARALIKPVCGDYGLEPPKLKWREQGPPSLFIEEEPAIEFRHRDNISLLHELAHYFHTNEVEDAPHANHGPGFVWWAIELYSHYAGIDLDYLVESAKKRSLLGDMETPSIAFGRAGTLSDKFREASRPPPERRGANDNRIRLQDLDIQAEHRHEVSGARLILGRMKNGEKSVVAWIAPWQKTLTDFKTRTSPEAARRLFRQMKKKDPPVTPSLRRDWQKSLCYEWQDKYIGKGTARLTEEQMKRVVERVSEAFNIEAPKVRYEKPRTSPADATSWYESGHKITMHHKDYYMLLHELAHGIDRKLNGNKWSDHGPSFIRTMIAVASMFHWSDPEELEKAANDMGISVAPAKALSNLPQP